MESIIISSITNNLSTETITIATPEGETVTLTPGDSMEFGDYSLPIISSQAELNSNTLIGFTVEGLSQNFAYAAIAGQGLVSALGHSEADFFPEDSHLVHITLPNLQAGDAIHCTFSIDEIPDGTRVSWVLGELDEA